MTTLSPFAVSLSAIALSEADQPTRIPLAMVGTFHKGKLKFSITRADVATMASNFAKDGKGEVVLDYEHASAQPEVAAGGPIPAAGWIVSIDDKPDAQGVVWGAVNFTTKARQMIDAREYKYVSPVLNWGGRDKSTGEQQGLTLQSAALTNTPVLDKMPAIQLSDVGWVRGDEQTMAKEKVMCSEHPRTPMLCPTCDKDEMQSLVAASDHTRVFRLSDFTRDGEGRLSVASVPAGAFVAIEVVRAMDSERIALSEVAAAVEKGKIAPAQRAHFTKLALSDIDTFREIVKPMQAVDLTVHGVGGDGVKGGKAELDQINLKLSDRAGEIVKAKKLPYPDAYKEAVRENPELLKRRNVLTSQAHKVAAGGDEE